MKNGKCGKKEEGGISNERRIIALLLSFEPADPEEDNFATHV